MMTETGSVSDDISRIADKDVRLENVRAINSARNFIVTGMFGLLGLTALGAILGATLERASSWGQLSPVIDTLLAGEFAALGAIVAFYMTRQD